MHRLQLEYNQDALDVTYHLMVYTYWPNHINYWQNREKWYSINYKEYSAIVKINGVQIEEAFLSSQMRQNRDHFLKEELGNLWT